MCSMLLILDQLYCRNCNRGARRHCSISFLSINLLFVQTKIMYKPFNGQFSFQCVHPYTGDQRISMERPYGTRELWEFQLDRRLIGRRLRGHAPVFRRPRRRGCGTGHTHWIPAMMILVAMSLIVTPPSARWQRAFNDANSCTTVPSDNS